MLKTLLSSVLNSSRARIYTRARLHTYTRVGLFTVLTASLVFGASLAAASQETVGQGSAAVQVIETRSPEQIAADEAAMAIAKEKEAEEKASQTSGSSTAAVSVVAGDPPAAPQILGRIEANSPNENTVILAVESAPGTLLMLNDIPVGRATPRQPILHVEVPLSEEGKEFTFTSVNKIDQTSEPLAITMNRSAADKWEAIKPISSKKQEVVSFEEVKREFDLNKDRSEGIYFSHDVLYGPEALAIQLHGLSRFLLLFAIMVLGRPRPRRA